MNKINKDCYYYSGEQEKNTKSLRLKTRNQAKLKPKASSRGRFQTRIMNGFTGNESTHVEQRETQELT